MRISVCGPNREGLVKKLEIKYGVESISPMYPGMEDDENKLFAVAAETYKYFETPNVIFNGGVFDNYKNYSDEGWYNLQEQVIISSVANVDAVIVVTDGMSEKDVEFCQSYAFLTDNVILIPDENTPIEF